MAHDRPSDEARDAVRDPTRPEEELRAEIDRLRLANQTLLEQLVEVQHPGRALVWHGKYLWHEAWQQYYIARWKLLHERNPRRDRRETHAPYVVRPLHAPLADRPRILHFIGNFHTGGSARLIVDLVEHLGHRFEQQVVVRSLPPTPAYTNIELIHRERLTGPGRISRILRSFRPDIVHVHLLGHQHNEYGKRDWRWYHNVFRAVEAAGVPCVENINIPVEPYISPAVRSYVYVSEDVRTRFARQSAWNETIYPGSDLELFSRPADVPVADDSIGMVYRLQPDKLDAGSIEPFIEVAQRRPGTRVTIVGGGQFLELYERRVAAAGVTSAFTFTGYVPYSDLPRLLAGMSIFVAPVHTESFGQVSAFAMGMGLPVVAYDVGALPEITAAPELLAPAGDATRLADIIIDLLNDRARRLRIGEENRRRAQALFSVQAMVNRYEALYDDVLSTAGTSSRPVRPGGARHTELDVRARSTGAPVVTVVMAVRNGERYLREAIESILAQTYRSFELLIIDDASTDRTRAVIDSYHDRRIRVLENERQLGLSKSLNRGIAEARGRYIARLDADDVAEPDRFAAQADFLDARPEVGLVGSWYRIIDADGREIGRRWVPCGHEEIQWMLGFCNAFAHSAVMIRKTALDEVGPYDESLVYAMDYELWLRIAERMRVANLDRFLARWRTNPASLTAALGDKTELLDRVIPDLAARLRWPADAGAENARKAELLSGIVAGSPADMSIEDAEWAVESLLTLHEQYCASLPNADVMTPGLRANMRRETARCMLWLGHRFPDRRDRAYARRAFGLAARIDRHALRSREGVALLLKLVGGRATVSAARSLAHRLARP